MANLSMPYFGFMDLAVALWLAYHILESPQFMVEGSAEGAAGGSCMGEEVMPALDQILGQQPYPCFKLSSVPIELKSQLKKGMLCLYNIESHSFEFPTVGRLEPADQLLPYLDFIGYYSINDFRDLVFAGVLPINCPSCKGPVEDAGMISFEVEEPGTADIDVANGDAELFLCKFCRRPFAMIPIT